MNTQLNASGQCSGRPITTLTLSPITRDSHFPSHTYAEREVERRASQWSPRGARSWPWGADGLILRDRQRMERDAAT